MVRNQALARRFAEMESGLTRLLEEPISSDQLSEVHEILPGADLAVFDQAGERLFSTTKREIPLIVGRSKEKDILRVGVRHRGQTVVIESSWAETEQGNKQLATVLTSLWIVAVVISSGVAWFVSGGVLRPVRELITSASKLASELGNGQLTTTDQAEFYALTRSLNSMIDAVRRSAAAQEQFAVDAAHELRTPLALLRLKLETSLQKERSPSEYVATESAMLAQVERLSVLIESLLETAREGQLTLEPVNLNETVRIIAQRWCEESGWPVERLILTASRQVAVANTNALEIVLRNLLDNASAHAEAETPITIEVGSLGKACCFSVENQGPQIPEETREKMFERYFRGDSEGDQKRGGAGIGLAVVQRLVVGMRGSVHCEPTDSGVRIVARLPGADIRQ